VQTRLGRRRARASFAAVAASLAVELTAPRARGTLADAAASAESEAEQLAAQAYELHAAGKYDEAIAAYLKAYDVSNAGAALLNVATIYDRRLHDRPRAAEYYRRYLVAPDAESELAERASARLAALKHDEDAEESTREVGDAATAVSPATPAPGAPATTSSPPASAAPETVESARNDSWKTIGLVVGGAGLASVGASLVIGALALVKNRDADMMCNGSVCPSQTGVDLAQQSGRLATASTIAFFAGLALAGGGLTILVAAPKTPGSAPRRAVALTVSPAAATDFAGLDVQGGF